MPELLGSRIAGGNSEYGRKDSDFYPTPPEATIALLRHLDLSLDTVIWEPACGEGHMVETMQSAGFSVVASDINEECFGDGGTDFLKCDLYNCDWIITNPPFKDAENFIKRCAYHNKPFALLLKSQYWHSKKRYDLFNEITPTEVLPLTWRPDFLFKTRGKGSPLMDCLWCVWDRNPSKTTTYTLLSKPNM